MFGLNAAFEVRIFNPCLASLKIYFYPIKQATIFWRLPPSERIRDQRHSTRDAQRHAVAWHVTRAQRQRR